MAVGNVKAYESLISGQDGFVRDMAKKPAAEAKPEAQVATDSFQVSSSSDALRQLESGGVAKSAEFRAPKFFRS